MDPLGSPDGKIEIKGDLAGTYEWGEVTAPSGNLLAKPRMTTHDDSRRS